MPRIIKILLVIAAVIAAIVITKVIWVQVAMRHVGTWESEKTEILERRNYLISKINVSPQQLIDEMPAAVGRQFQGEWAIYSLSMLTQALTNISTLYPETKGENMPYIDSLIRIALAPEIRYYDKIRWYYEDPLESLDGDNSHLSYISHVAWMMSNYRTLGGNDKYDALYDSLCSAMNRRILASPTLNIPTYPNEPIYVPDMLVAIVALNNYARQHDGRYQSTVDAWLNKAKAEWLDPTTGMLQSYLSAPDYYYDDDDDINYTPVWPLSGSYAAVNCSYLTFVDSAFAHEQYELLKRYFLQRSPIPGIREYYDEDCQLGYYVDAGPILLNLSPSGTAFSLAAVTYFGDTALRKDFLHTAELAGFTVRGKGTRHYLLADIALVGEAITLAMRTTTLKL